MLNFLKNCLLSTKSGDINSCILVSIDSNQLKFFVSHSVANNTTRIRIITLISNCLNQFVLGKARCIITLQLNYLLQHGQHLLVVVEVNPAALRLE